MAVAACKANWASRVAAARSVSILPHTTVLQVILSEMLRQTLPSTGATATNQSRHLDRQHCAGSNGAGRQDNRNRDGDDQPVVSTAYDEGCVTASNIEMVAPTVGMRRSAPGI
jgi:hypothetical protein